MRRSRIQSSTTGLVLVLVLVSVGLARADDARSPAAARIDDDARFAELVRQGDQARAAGKLSDTVTAYTDALRIHEDARLRGRLGLIALEGGATAEAVHLLLLAIVDGHDIPPAERKQIVAAFERARPLVCRLDIAVSHLGAEVRIDGELEPASIKRNDFYAFVLPGRREVRASLPGFVDAVKIVDAPKGGRVAVPLDFTAASTPPSSPSSASSDAAVSSPSPPLPAPAASSPNSTARPPASSPPKALSLPPRRWTPSFGTTVLYGAVSPLPAFGVVASSEWPFGEAFAWRLDLRGAMSPRDVEGYAVRGAVLGAWPGICGRVHWFSACLLASGGVLNRSRREPTAISAWRPFAGLGAGGVAAIPAGPVDIRLSLDAAVLLDRYELTVGGLTLWSSHPFLAGFSILAAVR